MSGSSVPDVLAGTRHSTVGKDVGTSEFPRTRQFDHMGRCGLMLNSYQRTFGVDTQALKQQVEDKQRCDDLKKKRDQMWEAQEAYLDGQLQAAAAAHMAQTRSERAALEAYHKDSQLKTTRREWDLNDNVARHNEPAARESDDDPRLSASGCQQFEGEDHIAQERKKMQQEQLAAWAEAKVAENARCAEEKKTEQSRYDAMMAAHAAMASQAAYDASVVAKEHDAATAAAWDVQKAKRKECDEKLALEDSAKEANEIAEAMGSNVLTERPIPSYLGPHRIRTDHYRGMDRNQLAAIRAEQEMQRREKQQCAENATRREMAYANQSKGMLGLMHASAAAQAADRRRANVELAEEHKRQMAEKKACDAKRNADFSGGITNDFHRYFGVCPTTREREKIAEFAAMKTGL